MSSWCFPHLPFLFLSRYHLLHIIIPPPCLLISWGSPPCCNAQHVVSYSQNRRAPLLPPFLTLSTCHTFSNTVSLNFILGFSSFNLQHFILGVACSDVQRFPSHLLLLMCQFRSPPTITLSPSGVALSS